MKNSIVFLFTLLITTISYKAYTMYPLYTCYTFIYGQDGVESSRERVCEITGWQVEADDIRFDRYYGEGVFEHVGNVYINNGQEVTREQMIQQCINVSETQYDDCARYASYAGGGGGLGCRKLKGLPFLICSAAAVVGIPEYINSICEDNKTTRDVDCLAMQLP